jgi:alpha-mannosidase
MRRVQNPLPQLIPQRVTRLRAQLKGMLWERVLPLEATAGKVHEHPIDLARALRRPMRPVRPGEHFGPPGGGWQQRWFRVRVPAASSVEKGRRFLQWDCQGETIAYHRGVPWAGLDIAHRTCPLPDQAATLWLDCGTWQTGIWPAGVSPLAAQIGRDGLRFDGCSLRVRNLLAWEVSWDLEAFTRLMNQLLTIEGLKGPGVFGHVATLDSCSPLLRQLLHLLNQACDAFLQHGLAGLRQSLRLARTRFRAESWQLKAALCGHAHLDLVWLWPEVATEHKGVHGFATQLRVMERYPEIVFVQSQPALYRAVERLSPALMRAVRRRIREGRWEVVGGFEVEPDNNLPCGEALARSLVHGQRKIADLSGRASPVCWLPDVFGYSSCLPQILSLGGVRYFFTTKMTWSQITRFPYSSFVWRGSDGSEVLAHLCPTGYNGNVELENLARATREYRQGDVHSEVLLPTGFGDGGGGLTEDMCERSRRLANLTGSPKTRWTTSEGFFRRLDRARQQLPVYQGELYLEYHRGTYTTQSEFKRLYRAAESALQAHEAVRVATGGAPLDESAWLRVLFGQFHDAIPGSSIGLVYQQLNPELRAIGDRELKAARAELRQGGKNEALIFNPLTLPRTVTVELPDDRRRATADGRAVLTQPIRDPSGARVLACLALPALAGVVVNRTGKSTRRLQSSATGIQEATSRVLDNGIVRATFDRRGQIDQLAISGARLELDGRAGFRLYDDLPANFDAWDIDHYTMATGQPVAAALTLHLVERGPVRARLRGQAQIGAASRMIVDYVLEAGCDHLRVELRVSWHESNRLLKFHVPTRYLGRWARFGCPFGSVQRPQLPGTPNDEAMWEVPGSRWAAVTNEDGSGLAICTEAKFGFSCRDGDLGLSLLRSPKMPDPQADQGDHLIRFALGRHQPATSQTALSTAASADALFAPVLVARGSADADAVRVGGAGNARAVLGATGNPRRVHRAPARDPRHPGYSRPAVETAAERRSRGLSRTSDRPAPADRCAFLWNRLPPVPGRERTSPLTTPLRPSLVAHPRAAR